MICNQRLLCNKYSSFRVVKIISAGFQRMVEMLFYLYPINHTWLLHVDITCINPGIVDSKHFCLRKQCSKIIDSGCHFTMWHHYGKGLLIADQQSLVRFTMPLRASVIISQVCWVDSFNWRYVGIPAWREVSDHFTEPLEGSLRDFKDLIISKITKEIICTIF